MPQALRLSLTRRLSRPGPGAPSHDSESVIDRPGPGTRAQAGAERRGDGRPREPAAAASESVAAGLSGGRRGPGAGPPAARGRFLPRQSCSSHGSNLLKALCATLRDVCPSHQS